MKKCLYAFLAALLVWAGGICPAMSASLPDFREQAKKDGPAVVNITAERKQPEQPEGMPGFRNPAPFDNFFNMFPPFFRNPAPRSNTARGSGFLISEDGLIVTNNHVIENADDVKVALPDASTPYTAEVIGTDPETDLALLKIKTDKRLPFLSFGDSDALEVGEWVIAIGNPFGLERSITAGILSAKGRDIQSGPFDSFLQTDASINPGNSGGPLLNQAGEVIGINTAIIPAGQGIGFAIPSNMAKNVIEQLKADKTVHRGWLGVQIQAIDENTAKALGRKDTSGALIGMVFTDSPAARAGIQDGDIIVRIGNHTVESSADLLKTVAQLPPGEKTTVTVWRDGREKSMELSLGERSAAIAQTKERSRSSENASQLLGMQMRPISNEESKALGLAAPQGLLITSVDKNGKAAEAGIAPGDVILSANLIPVNTVGELRDVLKGDAEKKGAVTFRIMRRGEVSFKTLPL